MTHDKRTLPAPGFPVSDVTLRRFFGYHMKRAFNIVRDDLTRTLAPLGLRMLTYTALVLIVDNPGLSQAQLAEAMDVERPNLVAIVDDLENRGLIVRHRAPNDRRTHALRATSLGERTCAQALAAVETHEARLFAGLDAEVRAAIVGVFDAVRQGARGDEA